MKLTPIRVALILTFLAAGMAQGQQVLFTNFRAGSPAYNPVTVWHLGGCGDLAIAVRFTPSQTSGFADAKLVLTNRDVPNQASLDLEADAAGSPSGVSLEHISVTGLPTNYPANSVITFTSVTHPALTFGSFYWLVVSTADQESCDFWYYNIKGDNTDGTNFTVGLSPNGPFFPPSAYPTTSPGLTRPVFQVDGSVFRPTVTQNPSDETVCAGSTATFTAAATGSPGPTVQMAGEHRWGSHLQRYPRRDFHHAEFHSPGYAEWESIPRSVHQ
jgi:hypothetical protein